MAGGWYWTRIQWRVDRDGGAKRCVSPTSQTDTEDASLFDPCSYTDKSRSLEWLKDPRGREAQLRLEGGGDLVILTHGGRHLR